MAKKAPKKTKTRKTRRACVGTNPERLRRGSVVTFVPGWDRHFEGGFWSGRAEFEPDDAPRCVVTSVEPWTGRTRAGGPVGGTSVRLEVPGLRRGERAVYRMAVPAKHLTRWCRP